MIFKIVVEIAQLTDAPIENREFEAYYPFDGPIGLCSQYYPVKELGITASGLWYALESAALQRKVPRTVGSHRGSRSGLDD